MNRSDKIMAIYMRVSTTQQTTASQKPDLQRWIDAQNPDDLGRVLWYRDKSTGTNTDRPGWQKLQRAIDRGEVQRVVCWRLDRLGRSASDLCRLFDQLKARKINLISLKESIDLKSAGGRLLANIMASVAAFENELRAERVKAGQIVARADTWKCSKCKKQFKGNDLVKCPECGADDIKVVKQGKRWGGSKRGRLHTITPERVKLIKRLKDEGERITTIARTIGTDRKSIYRVLGYLKNGTLTIEV